MFETSATTEKLDDALAKVQGELESAAKDKTNPHFKSRYADLTSVWEACRPALVKHGVSVTQWPVESADGRVHIVTRVAHKGEWMRCSFSVPVQKQDAQGFGSALTYLRRYTLSAALGIVADEDDDGNAASRPAPTRAPIKNFAPKPKTEEIDELDRALKGSPNPGDFVIGGGKFKGKRVRDVPKVDINSFIDYVHAEQSKNSEFSLGKDAADYYSAAIQFLSEQGEHR